MTVQSQEGGKYYVTFASYNAGPNRIADLRKVAYMLTLEESPPIKCA